MINAELSLEERREIFKKLKKYQVSKEWKDLISEWEKNAEKLLEVIKLEIVTREKAELVFSELDKLKAYIEFVENIISKISNETFKQHLQEQVDNGYTHMFNKVEVSFDAPFYSRLDKVKELRNMNLTIWRRLEDVIAYYDDEKKEWDNANPYED